MHPVSAPHRVLCACVRVCRSKKRQRKEQTGTNQFPQTLAHACALWLNAHPPESQRCADLRQCNVKPTTARRLHRMTAPAAHRPTPLPHVHPPKGRSAFLMSRTMATGSLVVAAMVGLAAGHGAMTFPKPRNSLDGVIEPWTKWAYPCDETHKGDDCAITFCENGQVCAHSSVVRHTAEPGAATMMPVTVHWPRTLARLNFRRSHSLVQPPARVLAHRANSCGVFLRAAAARHRSSPELRGELSSVRSQAWRP
jgi:hypothetical protein